METADIVVVAVIFGILIACLIVDWWVRSREP